MAIRTKKRTPAEDAEARKRTAAKHDFNREVNAERARINKAEYANMSILNPLPRTRNTEDGNPNSNRGNGSPLRPSQVKRAVSRIGKPRKDDK